MRVSRHNGRSGKHGIYNPKHNDRRFDVQHSEHIDPERKKENLYWDCYHGISKDGKLAEMTFEQVEEKFYEEIFADFIKGQNRGKWRLYFIRRDFSTDMIGLSDISTGKIDWNE